MSESNEKLSEADRNRIAQWVDKRAGESKCNVCGHDLWVVGSHLLEGRVYSRTSPTAAEATYPMAFVVCANCHHVRHFMAMGMGLEFFEEDEGDGGA